MSINREEVKDISTSQGYDAAVEYLVSSHNCSLSEARRIVIQITGEEAPKPVDIPSVFYCIRDNETVAEASDKTAICSICKIDLSTEIIDNIEEGSGILKDA